jgi:hypothetical protein
VTKRTTIITLVLLVLCFQGLAVTPPLIIPPTTSLTTVEIKPVAIPDSATVACAETIWLDTLTLTNTTSGSLTILIADQQGSPVTIIPTTTIPANSYTVIQLWGTRLEGGFKWTASNTGMNGYFRGKVRR